MLEKKNIEKILIISVIAIFVVVSATFAFFQSQLQGSEEGNINIISETTDRLNFDISDEINLNINQFNFGVGAGNLNRSATGTATLLANSKTNTANYTYYVYFKINSNDFVYTTSDSKPEIILTITNPSGQEVTSIEGLNYVTATGADGIQVKGFDITTASGLFAVAENYAISSNSSTTPTTQEWSFKATFINLDSDQQNNTGKNMDAKIIMQREEYKTIASYIINDVYTADGENGLYYHDGVGSYTNADQEAGDNSYRYSGANPNNYVCFGSDADTCPDEYLYRIIGVFDEDSDGEYNVKLIKADYTTSAMLGTDSRDYEGNYSYSTSNYKGSMVTSTIAAYRWNYDTSVNSYGSNNWTTSELNKTNLNTNYISYLGNSWSDMIDDSTWHLGGMTSASNTAKSFYTGERNNAGYGSNPTTYGPENASGNSTKIGLMYPSDFGYAAYPDAWTTYLVSYDSSTINENNWLYMGLYEWTITPRSSSSFYVFYLLSNGSLDSSNAYYGVSVRPVFYLKSNISYVEGNGTKASPFKVGV